MNFRSPRRSSSSGRSPRARPSAGFAGAAADEVVDPRPYAELIRQWSSFHPEFSALPRKFKMAVIAAEADRAAMRLHDIGIRLVRNETGELGAQFYVGGGMGRTPMIAPLIRDFVPLDQFITYCEACLRVYNRHGRRDNKYKARIKILVHELGKDEYTRQVEAEFAHLLSQNIEPPLAELERIKAQFVDPPFETGLSDEIDRSDPDFALWVDNNTVAHKAPGYGVVSISLKPAGGIPGDASAEQMRLMADLAAQHRLLLDEAADLRPRLGEPLHGRAYQALIDLIVGAWIVEELQGQAAAADHVLVLEQLLLDEPAVEHRAVARAGVLELVVSVGQPAHEGVLAGGPLVLALDGVVLGSPDADRLTAEPQIQDHPLLGGNRQPRRHGLHDSPQNPLPGSRGTAPRCARPTHEDRSH